MGTEKNRGRKFIDFELLPSEIITDILSRLPADSAVACRCICKQWRSLIDDLSFVDTHTHHLISSSSNPEKFGNDILSTSFSSGFFLCAQQKTSSFSLRFVEYNDDKERLVPEFILSKSITDHYFPYYSDYKGLMISSCNGLVFMGSTKPNDMFVCNPFTGECMNLGTFPTFTFDRNHNWWSVPERDHTTFGFGYHPCANKYKVVSIYQDPYYVKGQVSVYTLGSGVGWRSKGEIPYSLSSIDQPGLFVNGAIHWYMDDDDGDEKIISFDLADEEFRVIVPLPPPPSPKYIDQLGMLEGCLCVIRSDKFKCKYVPKDVWMLIVDKEDKFSWNMKFSIPWRSESTSLAEPCAVLEPYEPKTEAFYGWCSFIWNGLFIIPYIKSLVSLKALRKGLFISIKLMTSSIGGTHLLLRYKLLRPVLLHGQQSEFIYTMKNSKLLTFKMVIS